MTHDRSLASMGIYVFNCDTLIKALRDDHSNPQSTHDFGNDILPKLIQERGVFGYQFGREPGRVSVDRYWRDVGTIDSGLALYRRKRRYDSTGDDRGF